MHMDFFIDDKDYKKEAKKLTYDIRIYYPEIYDLMKKYNVVIAGGAVASVFSHRMINDYDIYFPANDDGTDDFDKFISEIDNMHQVVRTMSTDFAYSYNFINLDLKIQCIKIYKGFSIIDILNKFDFSVCMGAYSPKFDYFVFHNNFLPDNGSKFMQININTEFPISTFVRVSKYIEKGYTVSGIDLIKLALTIHNLKIDTLDDLRKHIIGIDLNILDSLLNSLKDSKEPYDYCKFLDLIDVQYTNYIEQF